MTGATGSTNGKDYVPAKNSFPADPSQYSQYSSDPYTQPTEIKIYVSDHGQKGTLDAEDKVMFQAYNMLGQFVSQSRWMTPVEFVHKKFNFFQQSFVGTFGGAWLQDYEKLKMLTQQGPVSKERFPQIKDPFFVQVCWFTDQVPKEHIFPIEAKLDFFINVTSGTPLYYNFIRGFSTLKKI